MEFRKIRGVPMQDEGQPQQQLPASSIWNDHLDGLRLRRRGCGLDRLNFADNLNLERECKEKHEERHETRQKGFERQAGSKIHVDSRRKRGRASWSYVGSTGSLYGNESDFRYYLLHRKRSLARRQRERTAYRNGLEDIGRSAKFSGSNARKTNGQRREND